MLLNDMIHEVMVKYDKEIARCTAYYSAQCALMEVARGQIAAANYVAATSRALILDAQETNVYYSKSVDFGHSPSPPVTVTAVTRPWS